MAFVRPIVYVYQQFQSVVLSPGVPDLNCCIVGPAFHIQDYPTDKTDISVGEFVKSGEDKDAACDDDGLSTGRPDPSSDFLVLSDPPNHISGGVLDAASVKLMFDECLIDLAHSNNGALTANSPILTCAGFNFTTQKVAVGDRVVLTKDDLSETVVTTVREVAPGGDNTKLKLVSSTLSATVGTADVNWRVEHELSDVEIGSSYYAVAGNQITIKTLANGVQTLYEGSSWTVNYAQMYVGYREHRTDLQDVQVINSVDTIETTLGRIDERNPLAVGVQVAMANTSTPVQAFGVLTDDLAGHQSARDRMSSRSDIYCIVPVTDALTMSSWVNVIAMWKNHCVAYAAFDVAKFRVVIGSYDDLPAEKSSVAPSMTGNTEVSAPATAPFDMFIDPNASTNFLTAEVGSTHLLDVAHAHADQITVATGSTIFDKDYAAKQLRGAIGSKRLRVAAGFEFGTAIHLSQTGMYLVRDAWLKAEGGTGYIEDVDAILWNDSGGVAQIEKTGAFTGVAAGDVAFVTGAATTGNNGGWRVTARTDNTLDLGDLTYAADANSGAPGFGCHVYHAVGYLDGGDVTAADNKFTATGAFTNAAVGDVIFCWDSGDSANKGMWVITNIIDNDNAVVGNPGSLLADDTGATDISVIRLPTVETNAAGSLSTRQRLDQLRDDSATFVGNVNPGEDIEIPYPASTNPLFWDTQTTKWAIDEVVSNEILIADLGDLEELAPDQFIQGYNADDMAYRVAIDLVSDSQVTELNTITTSLTSSRCVMTWPNEVYVTDVENALTSTQNRQPGQYLSCAVGGMVAGLPSHQGFTYIGIAGIQQIFNSNFYFTDSQLTDLRDGGWYVFVQDSETSLPYTIHEVTTDVSAYEFGEFMNVKNFDYIALYMKEVLEQFLGRYNITTETLESVRASLNAAAGYLQLRIFPKIGVPLLSAEIVSLAQSETERDRIEIFMNVELPSVVNQIGLHLVV